MNDNDYDYGSRTYDNSEVVEVSSKIMIATIIVLFMVIVFIVILHLYAKRYWIRRANGDNISSESQTSIFLHRGLEPSVIESLPVMIFNTDDFKDGLECSVCLCEVSDGEKARLLPKCNHGFHIECIDMWFRSHSTCPLCRNSLVPEPPNSSTELTPIESPEDNSGNGFSILSPNLPTNVLFWGNQMQVSSGGGSTVKQGDEPSSSSSSSSSVSNGHEGRLMIEIPRQLSEGFSSSGIEESKSPIIGRLRSLKRLLIRENSDIQCSPGSVDLELGRGQCSKIGSNS